MCVCGARDARRAFKMMHMFDATMRWTRAKHRNQFKLRALQNIRWNKAYLHQRYSVASDPHEKKLRRHVQIFAQFANLCSANAVQNNFAQNASREACERPESIKNERISAK